MWRSIGRFAGQNERVATEEIIKQIKTVCGNPGIDCETTVALFPTKDGDEIRLQGCRLSLSTHDNVLENVGNYMQLGDDDIHLCSFSDTGNDIAPAF